MSSETPPTFRTFIAIALISASIIAFQISLTRIFSVTLWYHYSFLLISIVMLGNTIGSLLVYYYQSRFIEDKAILYCRNCAILFGVTGSLSLLIHLQFSFLPDVTLAGFMRMGFLCISFIIPFVFSGISVCLLLTQFKNSFAKMYSADLIGASCSCILITLLLFAFDGITMAFLTLLLGVIGGLILQPVKQQSAINRAISLLGICFTLFCILNTFFSFSYGPLLRLHWIKGRYEPSPEWEKWNIFSRVSIHPASKAGMGWGLSKNLDDNLAIEQKLIAIDAGATTPITKFQGNIEALDFLRYDLTNLAHYLRSNANVFVVGAGGGRDVLSSLLFNQSSVTALEMNEHVYAAANQIMESYTGSLHKKPGVKYVVDEARSYLARDTMKYDIIQISLVDTFAASAIGAMSLSENTLYTTEAWQLFIKRLAPKGILGVSRWYFPWNQAESLRTTALAASALRKYGITDISKNLVVILNPTPKYQDAHGIGVMSVLVSRDPFSQEDIENIKNVSNKMGFTLLLSPTGHGDPDYQKVITSDGLKDLQNQLKMNLEAPTDDKPFFFNFTRFSDIIKGDFSTEAGFRTSGILAFIAAMVCLMSFLCVWVPYRWSRSEEEITHNHLIMQVFFASIGFGFMCIEIALLVKFGIFLGHPSYGILVVFAGLLFASGTGSLFIQCYLNRSFAINSKVVLAITLLILSLFGVLSSSFLSSFREVNTIYRIAIALLIIFPIGFCLGFPMSIGMKESTSYSNGIRAWFWATNGAFSVCGSVIAMLLAIFSSVTILFWCGAVCYLTALLAISSVRHS